MLKLPLKVLQIAGRFEAVQDDGNRLMALTKNEAHWLVRVVNEHSALESDVRERDAQIAEMREALEQYVDNFDDGSISNEKLKKWLDDKWIPNVRNLLQKVTK